MHYQWPSDVALGSASLACESIEVESESCFGIMALLLVFFYQYKEDSSKAIIVIHDT
jgi:hypothetical protein